MRTPHVPTLVCAAALVVTVLVAYHFLFGRRR